MPAMSSNHQEPKARDVSDVKQETHDIVRVDSNSESLVAVKAGDYKEKQVFKGTTLLWLAYQSIGAIYGDIGTSPLYVYSSTFSSAPSYEDLVGALSLIVWSITIMVTIKYVLIILHADNDGEGGTFSTYALLSRYANITNRDPREASLVKLQRYKTHELGQSTRTIRGKLETSKFLKGLLQVIGVLAVSMVIADGVLTPAQSVLGAVQGLTVVSTSITSAQVVGATAGILVLLYLIQPLGLTRLSSGFAPIIIVWLAFNGAFGIYNLVQFDYTVLKAFNPGQAFSFLVRNGESGWRKLGGVLLAFTGVEALFADLGAFSVRAIQISWLGWAFPMLLLAYSGQAAYISVNPGAYSNPFYNTVPPGMLYPSLIIAVLAAIVASQAMITATFQVNVVHTSKKFHGQVYVPAANWLMMVGTVLVAVIFNNTTSLGNAYGVCVIFVTLFDSCMVALAALLVWRLNLALVFVPWIFIICIDATFLSSALVKVPDGAWFTLSLATILSLIFILWRHGKEQQWKAEALDHFKPNSLVNLDQENNLVLSTESGVAKKLTKITSFHVFFDKAGKASPLVWIQFLIKFMAIPEVMVFFHVRSVEVPSVSDEDRYVVSRISGVPGCYRLVLRRGYMDEVITPDLAKVIYEQIRNYISMQDSSHMVQSVDSSFILSAAASQQPHDQDCVTTLVSPPSRHGQHANHLFETSTRIQEELSSLRTAYDNQILYIVGKESLKISNAASMLRKIALKIYLFIRENTRSKVSNLHLPADRIIEIGFIKDI